MSTEGICLDENQDLQTNDGKEIIRSLQETFQQSASLLEEDGVVLWYSVLAEIVGERASVVAPDIAVVHVGQGPLSEAHPVCCGHLANGLLHGERRTAR